MCISCIINLLVSTGKFNKFQNVEWRKFKVKVVKWNTLCQCDWAIIFLLIFKIFLLLFCCILNVSIALVSLQPFIILFSKNWQLSKATQSRLKFSAQNISESLKGWKEENCGPVRALWPFKEQYRVDFLFAVAQSSSEWEKLHLRKRRNPPQNEKNPPQNEKKSS